MSGTGPAVPNGSGTGSGRRAAAGGARGGEHGNKQLRVVSGPIPFAGGCPGAALDETHISGDEIEPAITVNPANPRNIVATWQQDLGFTARSDLIGSSRDGGQTWKRSTIPGLTVCTGGTTDSASDPWLAAGPDGTIYFLGIVLNLDGDLVNPPSSIVASRSRDGGRTWARATTVAPFDPVNDTGMIAANPTRAGTAYAVWANWDHTYTLHFPGSVSFSPHDRRWANLVPAAGNRPARSRGHRPGSPAPRPTRRDAAHRVRARRLRHRNRLAARHPLGR